MHYRIAVCDDDTAFAADFAARLGQVLDAKSVDGEITVFAAPDELRRAVADGQKFALLFLDVLFGETQQGLDLAAALRSAGCDADIVFMSVTPGYAAASFDAAPLHYLVKPVADEKLDAAIDRFLDKNTPYLLRFDTNRRYLQVHLDDVTYFEIFAREIVIHKVDGSKETCMGTLKELADRLPANTFVRPHRSYLVNLDHISEIVRYQIRVSSGQTIPVSQKLYAQVQRAVIDHADRRTVRL